MLTAACAVAGNPAPPIAARMTMPAQRREILRRVTFEVVSPTECEGGAVEVLTECDFMILFAFLKRRGKDCL